MAVRIVASVLQLIGVALMLIGVFSAGLAGYFYFQLVGMVLGS